MESIQNITDDHKIVNKLPFGEELYQLLRTDEAYAFLPDGDWVSGGCWLLAVALKQCCPALELCVLDIPNRAPALNHVVAKLSTPEGDVFLDGDGVATKEDLIKKMAFCEGVPDQVIGEYDLEALIKADVAQVYNPNISVAGFSRFLKDRLGSITIDRIILRSPKPPSPSRPGF